MATYETNHMAVKQEIKSQLAKLLATEDLVVEHRCVETAQFNVQTRVLTLPQWDEASNVVYDMLVCLLYTSPSPRDKRQSRMPSSA